MYRGLSAYFKINELETFRMARKNNNVKWTWTAVVLALVIDVYNVLLIFIMKLTQ